MADGHFPTLVSKDRDSNALANPIFTSVSDGVEQLEINADGSINVTVTGGASNTQYAEDTAHVSGDIGTMALVVRRDTPSSGVDADGDYAALSVDANGRLYAIVTGTVAVSSVAGNVTVVQPTGTNLHVVVDSGTIVVTATDLDIRDLSHTQDSVKIGDGTDFLAITAAGNAQVDIASQSLTAVKISKDANANSQTNPIFVQTVDNAITGEVTDYNTASAVAADATSNHDYTVTSTMKLRQITVAASGGAKFEIQVGPVASLVSKKVGFIPKEGGVVEVHFNPPLEVPNTSTGTVRVIRTNRQGQAQDLYSTIEGTDN